MNTLSTLKRLSKVSKLIKRAATVSAPQALISPEDYTNADQRQMEAIYAMNRFGEGENGVSVLRNQDGDIEMASPQELYILRNDQDRERIADIANALPDQEVYYADPQMENYGYASLDGNGNFLMEDKPDLKRHPYLEYELQRQRAKRIREDYQNLLDADIKRRGVPVTDSYRDAMRWANVKNPQARRFSAAPDGFGLPTSEEMDRTSKLNKDYLNYLFLSSFDGSVPQATSYPVRDANGQIQMKPILPIFQRANGIIAQKRNAARHKPASNYLKPIQYSPLKPIKEQQLQMFSTPRGDKKFRKLIGDPYMNDFRLEDYKDAPGFIANMAKGSVPLALNWSNPVSSFIQGKPMTPQSMLKTMAAPYKPADTTDLSSRWLKGVVPPTTPIKKP